MYNNIIRFGFCDIQNNQGLGKCYQLQPSAQLIEHLPQPSLFRITQNPNLIIIIVFKIAPGDKCNSMSESHTEKVHVRRMNFFVYC